MTIHEAAALLNRQFSIDQAEDFDNVGLLCGDRTKELTGILICHDALETVVEEAIEKNTNLILAFHPIIFSGLKSITGKNYVERAVLKALSAGISIYAVHTAFDNWFFGVNHGICRQLGLQNEQILMPKKNALKKLEVYVPEKYAGMLRDALLQAGAGSIGFYDECSFTVAGKGTFRPKPGSHPFMGTQDVREYAEEKLITVIFEDYREAQIISAMLKVHPYEEVAHQIISLDNAHHYAGLGKYGDLEHEMDEKDFLSLVKDKFRLKVIRHSAYTGKKVRRVGVLGGSGASGIVAAISAGCDAYLTGDLKYHDFFGAESRLLIADIGHFESEQFVTQQLFDILSEKFPKFAVSKSSVNTNPVNYFL